MKSLEKLKKVLGDITINEEQQSALDSFFEELYEHLKNKAHEEVVSEEYVLIEDAEAAFEMAMNDAEAAFDLFKEDAEAAFEMAMNDAEAAFDLFENDLIEEHTQGMTKALEDIYEGLLDKAKDELLTSPQFESLNKIKEILTPFILEESNSESLLKENKKLKEALRFLSEQKEELERDDIIDSLISELPNGEDEAIRKFLSESKTTEDIYERYNLALSLLEEKQKQSLNESSFDDEDEEEYDEEYDEDEDEEVNESVFYTESKNETQKPKRYSSIEEAIISTVFK